jgi:hypothetical protein
MRLQTVGLAMVMGAWAAVPVGAADDDLAVIRKAVAQSEAPAPAPDKPVVAAARKSEPQWLRIRVEPKGERKGRVRVNVPLAFVRAVGDSLPADFGPGCRREHREAYCGMKLSEVLKTLDSGQDLVEIDDDEQTVRVWLE